MTTYTTPAPSVIRSLFSNIAGRYDLLNFLLSFGLDRLWRRRAVLESLRPEDRSLLDLGTGSGKLIRTYCKRHSFRRVLGIDFCEPLLEKARKDLVSRPEVELEQADLLEMDLKGEQFDLISTSFVLRSISDHLDDFFRKVCDSLRSEGRFVILELTRPTSPLLKLLFRPYLTLYLPLLGKLISGNWSAYQFLAQSVLNFKEREEILSLLKRTGFRSVSIRPLSGGIATLFIACR